MSSEIQALIDKATEILRVDQIQEHERFTVFLNATPECLPLKAEIMQTNSSNPYKECYVNVPKPWSPAYFNYRAQFNGKILEAAGIISLFRLGLQLPDYFAVGLDERSIEYPWYLSCASKTARKILDAGSALNHPEILKHEYWNDKELTIVTLAPEANQFELDWLQYVYTDLRRLPFEDNHFDEIICISTLEHVGMDNTKFINLPDYNERNSSDYLDALSEIHRTLKPGGKLLLTVPFGKHMNYGEFQQFDKIMLDNAASLFSRENRNERYYYYTPTGWKLADSDEQCSNLEYSSYAIKSSWGGGMTSCPLDGDGAAAARAVACCIWEKPLDLISS